MVAAVRARRAQGLAGLLALLTCCTSTFAAANWPDIARWPDFMGGIWGVGNAVIAGGPAPYQGGQPELTPAAQAEREAYRKSSAQAGGSHSCIPDGLPTQVGGEFFYTRGAVFLMSDLDFFVVRQIFMRGDHDQDADPSYFGDSIGHWEGDKLVVDTVNFLPEVQVAPGVSGNGMTHIIETFRLTSRNSMEYVVTVENPEKLAKPWVLTRTLNRQAAWRVHETYCEQNNRNAPVDGRAAIDVRPPPAAKPHSVPAAPGGKSP